MRNYLSTGQERLPVMNICIMIVDDDRDDIEFFVEAVAAIEPNIQCASAKNGLEALQLITSGAVVPDYIFVDLNMPKMGGKQFIQELRKDNSFTNVKIIVYSTSKLEKDVKEVKSLGATEFIKKPTSFDGLQRDISDIIFG